MIAENAPCSTPGSPAAGQRRAVAAGLEPLARRLDPDQLDLGIVDERR